MLRARELLGKRRPSSPRFLAGVRDMDRRLEAAVKTAVFSQKVDQVEGLVDYARLTGPEWSGRVAGLCAGTGHLFFNRGGLPAQNFASVAKGKHRKILTRSWQPLVSIDMLIFSIAVFIKQYMYRYCTCIQHSALAL